MPKYITCDICGKEGSEDNEGYCLCEYHFLEKEIELLKNEYKHRRDWVVSVWVTELRKMKKEIEEKENELKIMQ
jgi:hypothetical protein